ncbi:3-oxoacyl-ACP reductase [Corticimicrobacter populi]|uniref:3-oxoacyl-ACP reductase n=1 Tax=Corticimicrobacter populi TaxID=2175229 RepID=A0A2V1K2V7_9BURK|nr:3-oxoacyl-ACP reductase [Corticimicrobacter populi]
MSNDHISATPDLEHTCPSRRHLLRIAALAAPAGMLMATGTAAVATEKASATGERISANGKVAIVTGSSRGIGAATARRLALDGYSVTINYLHNQDLAQDSVAYIENAGGKAISVQADVSDPDAVRKLFDATQEAFGGVDVVVSNAGVMRLASFASMSDEDFDRMMAVNLKGGFNVLRLAAQRVRDCGRIISLSSSITQLRSPTYGPYAASKGAQELFASVLAKELAGRQISVNAMAPGLVNTTLFTDGKTPEQIAGFAQRTPHQRLGEPEDIAHVISALCSGDGMWINGQTVFANGGVI